MIRQAFSVANYNIRKASRSCIFTVFNLWQASCTIWRKFSCIQYKFKANAAEKAKQQRIRLALELKPRRYKSAAEVAENGGGDGLRLISYVGGIAMCSRSAIAAITPPMLSAALADNVSTTDTYNKHIHHSDTYVS